jgi:Chromatin associated protein KTI12
VVVVVRDGVGGDVRAAVQWQIDGCEAPRRRSPVGILRWRGSETRRQGHRRVFSPPRSQPELRWFAFRFLSTSVLSSSFVFFFFAEILRSAVTDMVAEKNLRGVLRSEVDRSLSKDSIIIVDSLNNIKVLALSLSLDLTHTDTSMKHT